MTFDQLLLDLGIYQRQLREQLEQTKSQAAVFALLREDAELRDKVRRAIIEADGPI